MELGKGKTPAELASLLCPWPDRRHAAGRRQASTRVLSMSSMGPPAFGLSQSATRHRGEAAIRRGRTLSNRFPLPLPVGSPALKRIPNSAPLAHHIEARPPPPQAEAEVGASAAVPRAAAATRAILILRNMIISSGSGMRVLLHPPVAMVHPRPLVQITLSAGCLPRLLTGTQ
jgi:hypothetical protein